MQKVVGSNPISRFFAIPPQIGTLPTGEIGKIKSNHPITSISGTSSPKLRLRWLVALADVKEPKLEALLRIRDEEEVSWCCRHRSRPRSTTCSGSASAKRGGERFDERHFRAVIPAPGRIIRAAAGGFLAAADLASAFEAVAPGTTWLELQLARSGRL